MTCIKLTHAVLRGKNSMIFYRGLHVPGTDLGGLEKTLKEQLNLFNGKIRITP